MLLKHFVENLEKLANASVVKEDPGKFYKRLYDMACRFLSQSLIRLRTKLHGFTALTAIYSSIRSNHGLALVSTDADNMRNYLFIEISKILIGVDFLQLEDDNLTKRLFKKTIVDMKNMLQHLPDHQYFDALNNVMLAEWSNSTLLSMLRGDNLNKEVVLTYIKNVEHEDIVQLRIKALLGSDCEDLAQNLMNHCLVCDIFLENVEILLKRFQFLHKLGKLEEIHQLCSKLSSSTACKVLSKTNQNDICSTSLLLSRTFFLRDWVNPVDITCTKILLKNWMVFENRIGLQQDLLQGFNKVLSLTSNIKQFIVFIDVNEELFGSKFAELCSLLALRTIQSERHQFVCAHLYTKDTEDAESAKRSLAEICFVLMRLYRGHPQMNVCCLLSWHYLFPTETGYFMIEQYFLNAANSLLTSELFPPHNVSNDIYMRLYNTIELLRHDVLKVSLSWSELKPLLLSNMNRAGFRYTVANNHFVRFQPKNQVIFNVHDSRQKKNKSVNAVENHMMQEMKSSKKLNGLPSEMISLKSTRVQKATAQAHPVEETKVIDIASASHNGENSTKVESCISDSASNSCEDNLSSAMVEPSSSSITGRSIAEGIDSELSVSDVTVLQNSTDSKSLTKESCLGACDSLSSELQANELINDSEMDERNDAKEVNDNCMKESYVFSGDVSDIELTAITQDIEHVKGQQAELNSEEKSSDLEDKPKQNEFKSSHASNQEIQINNEINTRNQQWDSNFNLSSNPTFHSASPPLSNNTSHILLTEPIDDCNKDTLSLAVYDLNGPSSNSSELLLLVTHSESIESTHLDQINDNNNEVVFPVSIKRSMEALWSENVHDYDECGTRLISTRLVSSVQSLNGQAVAVDCSEETASIETLDMSVKIPGKEIFVSQQSFNILPVVGAEFLSCKTEPICFGCHVDLPPAIVVDTRSEPVVAISESLSTEVINERIVSDANLEPTSLPSVPDSLSFCEVNELDSDVAGVIETNSAVVQSSNIDTILATDSLLVAYPAIIEAPLPSSILEPDVAKSKVQSFGIAFAISESEPLVDIRYVESASYSLDVVRPTEFHPHTTSSSSNDMIDIELPSFNCQQLNALECKAGMQPSLSQHQLTVVAKSTAISGEVDQASIFVCDNPSSGIEVIMRDQLNLVPKNSQNVECTSFSNCRVMSAAHRSVNDHCDIFQNGEKQESDSSRYGEEVVLAEGELAIVLDRDSAVLQEENMPLVNDHSAVIDKVLSEIDIAFVIQQSVSETEVNDITDAVEKDFTVCNPLTLDNLALPSTEKLPFVLPVVTEMEHTDNKLDQKCDSSCSFASLCSDDLQYLNVVEISPWQELSCPTPPFFARRLDDLVQKSLDFEMHSLQSLKRHKLPIVVIRTDFDKAFSLCFHDFSFLLPVFPEVLSISCLQSKQIAQSVSLEPEEILSEHCFVQNPENSVESTASDDREIDVDQFQPESLANHSLMEYRCHICDKILNSSKGHRLHAIRVHQVDCIDHLSPAMGYSCRKCHKPIALSKIANRHTRHKSNFCTCRSRQKELGEIKDSHPGGSAEACKFQINLNSLHVNLTHCISSSEKRLCTPASSPDCNIGNPFSADTESQKMQYIMGGSGLCTADASLCVVANQCNEEVDIGVEQFKFSHREIIAENNLVLEIDQDSSYLFDYATGCGLDLCKIDSNNKSSCSIEDNSCAKDLLPSQHKMISEDNCHIVNLADDHQTESFQFLSNLNSDAVECQTQENKNAEDSGSDVHVNEQILKHRDLCQIVSDENQCPAESCHSHNLALNSKSCHYITDQEGNNFHKEGCGQNCLDSKSDCIVTDADGDESLSAQQHYDLKDFNYCLKSSPQNVLLDKMKSKPDIAENMTSFSVDFQDDITSSCNSVFCEVPGRRSVKDLTVLERSKIRLQEKLCRSNEESSSTVDIQLLNEKAIPGSNYDKNNWSYRSQNLDITVEFDEMFSKLITNAEASRNCIAINSNITESACIREKIEIQKTQKAITCSDNDTNRQYKAKTKYCSYVDEILDDFFSEKAQHVERAVLSSGTENLNVEDLKSAVDTENDRCTEKKSNPDYIQGTSSACPVEATSVTDGADNSSKHTPQTPSSGLGYLSNDLFTKLNTLFVEKNTAANDSTNVVLCVAANRDAAEGRGNANYVLSNLDLQVLSTDCNYDEISSDYIKSKEKLFRSNPSGLAQSNAASHETTNKISSMDSEQSLLSTVIKLTVAKKQTPIPQSIPMKLVGFPAMSHTFDSSNTTPLYELMGSTSKKYSIVSPEGKRIKVLQAQDQATKASERLAFSSDFSIWPSATEKRLGCLTLNKGIFQLPSDKTEVIEKIKQFKMSSCTAALPLKTFPVSVSHCVEKMFQKTETGHFINHNCTGIKKIKRNSVKELISDINSSSATVQLMNKEANLSSRYQGNDDCKREMNEQSVIQRHTRTASYSETECSLHRQINSVAEVKPTVKFCKLLKDCSQKKTSVDWVCEKCGELLPSYSCWKVHIKSCHASNLIPSLQTESSPLESRKAKMKRKSSVDVVSSDSLYGKVLKMTSKREQVAAKLVPQSSLQQSSDVDDFSSGHVRFEGKTYIRVKNRSGTP